MLLTEKALEEKRMEIERLNDRLKEIYKEKRLSQSAGNTFHDNFGFEQAEIQERGILKQIRDLKHEIETATIVEEKDNDSNSVKVGNHVTLKVDYGNEDVDIVQGELVALPKDPKLELSQITLNSPIGKAIFMKKVGDEVRCVLPNGNKVKILISKIEN
ncbi:MAG: GreA/GreB family elongation factor [Clostridia bacterium]|nr:GreA/GreB family elongation factor [Clostridia bacterium]